MSATTPSVGIDHPTVVPANFDPDDDATLGGRRTRLRRGKRPLRVVARGVVVAGRLGRRVVVRV
ncbi:hypothetical protein DJ71_25320, partial [Halorubrum sp. E3]